MRVVDVDDDPERYAPGDTDYWCDVEPIGFEIEDGTTLALLSSLELVSEDGNGATS